MEIDFENMRKSKSKFDSIYSKSPQDSEDIIQEYAYFSSFIQSCFISKYGYIMDTGNFQNANYVMIPMITRQIQKHPLLWKLFFMIG